MVTWNNMKEVGGQALLGGFLGAAAQAGATYASAGINYLAGVTGVSVLTKALPVTDAMAKFVAPLGTSWNGAGVGAALVGGAVLARSVLHSTLKASGVWVSEKILPTSVQDSWYAQRAGSFVVYSVASLGAIAATLAVANFAGVALTTTAIAFAATGPAVLFVGEGIKVANDVRKYLAAGVSLYFANRALRSAEAALEAEQAKINGTRAAEKKQLKAERDELEAGDQTVEATKARLAEIKTKLTELKNSTDPTVIGLQGQLNIAIAAKTNASDAIANEAQVGTPLYAAFTAKDTDATTKKTYTDAVAAQQKIVTDNTTLIGELQTKIDAINVEINKAETGVQVVYDKAVEAQQKAQKAYNASYKKGDAK